MTGALFNQYRITGTLGTGGMGGGPGAGHWWVGTAMLLLLAFVAGFLMNNLRHSPRPFSAAGIRYLTYSGHDYSPAASADGKWVCFSSDQDGSVFPRTETGQLTSPMSSGRSSTNRELLPYRAFTS